MKLNAFAQKVIGEFPLGFVATLSADGRPCVSPKGTFLVLDDETIAFGEIRSPGTLANLEVNPECEVNFVDPFLRKGVRLRCTAEFIGRGSDDFKELLPKWQAVWTTLADRINVLVVLKIIEAKPLITPPYDEGVSEEEMVALYKQKYAEIYP